MYPELFKLPFITLTIKSYGLMMVIGFLLAVNVIRYLSRDITPDPQLITNAALYSLIAGVVGARLFYVIHYFDRFKSDLLSIFSIWKGGLELLGGVLLAIAVIIFYALYHKLPVRRYLDILAIGLVAALIFGRIGCFLNGCCFGKPTSLPWGIRFPYASLAYQSQVSADLKRNRPEPYLNLPEEFFFYSKTEDGLWSQELKPYKELNVKQRFMVDKGPFRCLAVHPTQLYESAGAALICIVLYLFWQRSINSYKLGKFDKYFIKPGSTFALMFMLYGIIRFFLEFLRDDNPFEFDGLTISQNISVVMVAFGVILMFIFSIMKAGSFVVQSQQNQNKAV